MIDGLDADIVTLALAYDVDAIAEKGQLLPISPSRPLHWLRKWPIVILYWPKGIAKPTTMKPRLAVC